MIVRGSRFTVAEEQGSLPAEPWQRLDELREWEEAHRVLAAWQARRAGAPHAFCVQREFPWTSTVEGQGILRQQPLAAQVWTRLAE